MKRCFFLGKKGAHMAMCLNSTENNKRRYKSMKSKQF